jgi:aryl-alcohol dehydrogenase-like predicted oxidoreductase
MDYMNIRGLEKPVSRLIFGTAWFSLSEEEEAHKMMDLYVERGGNMIDAGRYYGKGDGIAKSEEIIDRWLRSTKVKREDIMITDKCCNCLIDRKGVLHEEFVRVSPTFIQEDLMYSLDRVGVDYFDLYLIHRDDPSVPVPDLMDKLEELRIAGYFKAFGVSSWQPSRVAEAMEYCKRMNYRGPSVSSPSYSLIHAKHNRWPGTWYADDKFAQWHKDNDIALFAWAAQGAGFFVDPILPAYDKNTAPMATRESFLTEENYARRERALELARVHNCSGTNIALAYVLSQDLPLFAQVGPQNLWELDDCIKTLDLKLTQAEIEYLRLERDTYLG